MEFWGVEVKSGETLKCEPGEDRLLHLSQAALGDTKSKGAERVPIYVTFNDQKLVIGTLSAEKCTQISYDLVFEKEFELSHGSKGASVYFTGYKSDLPEDDDTFPGDFDGSDSEEDVTVAQNANGALKVKSQEEKPAKAKSNVDKVDNAKLKAGKLVKPEQMAGDGDDDDNDSEDDDDSEESDDDDGNMVEAMGDSDDEEDSDEDDDDEDDESSEEEDEETPKKSANGKKRLAKAASKTSAPEKKAKLTTPASEQKTGGDGKKVTPGKQSGKAPANSDKSKQQTPKSAGSVSCKSCSKSFNSENALEAHTKAKHSGAK